MTQRPVAEILRMLAEETAELTEIAGKCDQLIPSLMAQVPQGAHADMRALQRIDHLHQYLRETSQALSGMAALIEPAASVDVGALSDQAGLDHFRTRLREPSPARRTVPPEDDISLF